MPGIQVTVGLDSNSKLGIQLQGDENLLFSLIGALDYTKQAVIDRIKKRNGEVLWGGQQQQKTPPPAGIPVSIPVTREGAYSDEQKVSRDKAIEATEYTIASLQMRLEKMKTSPEEATFLIDPTLLAQL